MINKAFILRFFADGGMRVEGPFPLAQVQKYIDKQECFPLWKSPLVCVWGAPLSADDLHDYESWIREQISRLSTHRYQPLLANHYRTQHAHHWQVEP